MSIEPEKETEAFMPLSETQETEIKGIVRIPGVYGGWPCIEGHRIAVHDIAEYVQQGYNAQRIVSEVYPHLSLAQVAAAIHYYYEHQEEIDREIAEDIADVKKHAQEDITQLPSGSGSTSRSGVRKNWVRRVRVPDVLRYYFDEHTKTAIAEQLRVRGVDAQTAQEAGRAGQGIPDSEQLAYATSQGRVLVTREKREFPVLAYTQLPHAGIIHPSARCEYW